MKTDKLIVTNNSLVADSYENILELEGDFLDVLKKVRDMVYEDYSLVSHPLPASIRMFYSPVRSVIIKPGFSQNSVDLIEECIEKYELTMGIRKPDYRNLDDYKVLDLSLLGQAIKEICE